MMSICICSCGDPLSPVDSVTISGVPFHHACLLCVVGSPVFLSCIDLHCLALRCATRAWRERWSLSTRRTSLTAPRWEADYFSITTFDNLSLSRCCRTTQKGSALSALAARKQSSQKKERYFLTDKHEKSFTVTVIVTVCVWRKQSGRGTQHIQHLLFTCRLWITNVPQLSPPQTKASRLRAMEKDYHLECFKSVVKILKFG